MPTTPLAPHLKVRRVAAMIDKSDRFVKEEVKAGNLEGIRIGNEIVIPLASINKYLADRVMRKPKAA